MRDKILKLYKYRCIRCKRKSNTVHEIRPKSLVIDWETMDNMVVLCNDCHEKVHSGGAMNFYDELHTIQEHTLIAYYGTSDYRHIFERL